MTPTGTGDWATCAAVIAGCSRGSRTSSADTAQLAPRLRAPCLCERATHAIAAFLESTSNRVAWLGLESSSHATCLANIPGAWNTGGLRGSSRRRTPHPQGFKVGSRTRSLALGGCLHDPASGGTQYRLGNRREGSRQQHLAGSFIRKRGGVGAQTTRNCYWGGAGRCPDDHCA